MPPIHARYVHTNLVARDWRRLADFYTRVFGCEFAPPERDYSGPELAAGSGVPGATLRGAHLRLPGYDANGPTLEIYQYTPESLAPNATANRVGFGHIAFEVADVPAAVEAVLAKGGTKLGEIVTLRPPGKGAVTWTYVRDPEGNIVELQAWDA